MFPWPISQHMAERCHAGKSLCRSFRVIWPFLLQCSTQLHQLLLVVFPSDDFVGLEQLIIHYTHQISPHQIQSRRLAPMNIRLCRQDWWFACTWFLRIIVAYSFFITRHDTMQKNFFFCVFEATIHRSFCTFRRSSALIRTAPNCLLLNHSNDIQTSRNH